MFYVTGMLVFFTCYFVESDHLSWFLECMYTRPISIYMNAFPLHLLFLCVYCCTSQLAPCCNNE